MIEITSRKNKIVLDTLALHSKRGRDESGLFFTEGRKILAEAQAEGRVPLRVFVTEEYLASHTTSLPDCETVKVTREVYDKITDENAPEGVLAVFEKKEISPEKDSCILLLEGIQDPGNLGTMLRCATAFGVREVLTVGCADLYSPKTVRATMGAIFKMPCRSFGSIDDAVTYGRGACDTVVATALHADSVTLDRADTSRAVIMIGSEGRGLSDRAIKLSDKRVIIPIEGIESLNASVAGAICMYDAMMKRMHKK